MAKRTKHVDLTEDMPEDQIWDSIKTWNESGLRRSDRLKDDDIKDYFRESWIAKYGTEEWPFGDLRRIKVRMEDGSTFSMTHAFVLRYNGLIGLFTEHNGYYAWPEGIVAAIWEMPWRKKPKKIK